MGEYSEKFKDPRWQKTRLEILKRDGWACQVCGDKKNTLHVHHTTYFPGCDPWEYPDVVMITLCEVCHKKEHELEWPVVMDCINMLKEQGFLLKDISHILYDARKLYNTRHDIPERF